MANGIKATTVLVGTTALATIVTAPAAGKVRRVDLNACNITNPAAYAAADVYINDTGTPANSGYLRNGHPVPAPPDPDCAIVLAYGFFLTAGQEMQIRASDDDAISFVAEVVEDDADA